MINEINNPALAVKITIKSIGSYNPMKCSSKVCEMETKIIFICLLFAFQTVLSASYGAKRHKKLDYISVRGKPSATVIRRDFSDNLKSKPVRLQSDIDVYKQKIRQQRNAREKTEARVPKRCKKINCPLEEKPVCAKFFYKNRNVKPFYVIMINDCEMEYMKCYKGLESKIVPMDNCHSLTSGLQVPVQTDKRRAKRSVDNEGSPEKAASKENIRRSNKKITDKTLKKNSKPSRFKKETKPRSSSNVKIARLNKNDSFTHNKMNPIVKLYDKITKSSPKATFTQSKIKHNKSNLDLNKTTDSDNKTKVGNQDRVKHKLVGNTTSKNNVITKAVDEKIVYDKTNISIDTVHNDNSGNGTNITAIIPTNINRESKVKYLKSNSRPIMKTKERSKVSIGQKIINAPKRLRLIKNNKKIRIEKPISRQGPQGSKEFFEKNVADDKMFTHDVFSESNGKKHDIQVGSDEPSAEGIKETDINESNEKNDGNDNVIVDIEMDDADLEKVLGESGNDDIVSNEHLDTVPETHDSAPAIEGHIEIDDHELNELNPGADDSNPEVNSYNTESKNSNVGSKEAFIEGQIEIDDHNLDEMTGGNEASGDDNPKKNLDDEVGEAEAEKQDSQLPLNTNDQEYAPPLVEEPTVAESDTFVQEEEYHYEPEVLAPIVKLDVDKKAIEAQQNDLDRDVPAEGPTKAPDNDDGDHYTVDVDDIHVAGGENEGKDDDYPANKPPMYIPTSTSTYDKADLDQYAAECPTECPVRDLMVCAMCKHGVYKTFLSVCHMRMYQCKGKKDERLELVSRLPCVMSTPLLTSDPPMQPKGQLSEPNDKDRVLIYVRCRERGLLGKSPKCQFQEAEELSLPQPIDTDRIDEY